MKSDFSEVMSNRTDEELVKIVTVQRNDYQPEAVIAAEKEIEKRNLDINKIEEIKNEIETNDLEIKSTKTNTVNSLIRLLHLVIDFIMFFILAFILSVIIGFFVPNIETVNEKLFGYGIFLISFLAYYIFMEFKYQKTIGKFITKTKVVMTDGKKPELNDIIVRTICRLIPFDRISYIFTKNGFHDYLSKTTVIKE